jgi:hypothetical protein
MDVPACYQCGSSLAPLSDEAEQAARAACERLRELLGGGASVSPVEPAVAPSVATRLPHGEPAVEQAPAAHVDADAPRRAEGPANRRVTLAGRPWRTRAAWAALAFFVLAGAATYMVYRHPLSVAQRAELPSVRSLVDLIRRPVRATAGPSPSVTAEVANTPAQAAQDAIPAGAAPPSTKPDPATRAGSCTEAITALGLCATDPGQGR